eukprot:6182172-Pleurochrysis_carterae.AAC.2
MPTANCRPRGGEATVCNDECGRFAYGCSAVQERDCFFSSTMRRVSLDNDSRVTAKEEPPRHACYTFSPRWCLGAEASSEIFTMISL